MTCSKGPLAGIKPGSAAFMACALTTRPPARLKYFFYGAFEKCILPPKTKYSMVLVGARWLILNVRPPKVSRGQRCR